MNERRQFCCCCFAAGWLCIIRRQFGISIDGCNTNDDLFSFICFHNFAVFGQRFKKIVENDLFDGLKIDCHQICSKMK